MTAAGLRSEIVEGVGVVLFEQPNSQGESTRYRA